MKLLSLLLLSSLAACGATGSSYRPRTEPAPAEERREEELRRAEERRRNFQMVLIDLDKAMESYVQALANRGAMRADQQVERIEKLLREMVLDLGPTVIAKGVTPMPPGENYRRLQAAAIDGADRHAQGIALAALGFSGEPEMMPIILQGAQQEDPTLIDRAVFGLAALRAPATPPGVLAVVVDNQRLTEASRTQAAWALYRLQEVSEHRPEILAIWQRLLGATPPPPAGILVQSLRGIGFQRDPANAGLAAPFLRHAVPMVRMAAADAVARMNAQQYAADLIAMIGPEESSPNVRLHARKALQELAGSVDHGYDVVAWRKTFDRGR